MKLVSLLRPEAVVTELHAKDKMGVIKELSATLAGAVDGIDEKKVLKALAERERLGSTGVGDGVAIPHAKLPGLPQVVAAFGRSREGVDFDSPDGLPSHLFFMLIAPDNSIASHLEALKRVSKVLEKSDNRNRLKKATAEELYSLICLLDEEE